MIRLLMFNELQDFGGGFPAIFEHSMSISWLLLKHSNWPRRCRAALARLQRNHAADFPFMVYPMVGVVLGSGRTIIIFVVPF